MERIVDAAPGVRLWSERAGPSSGEPVLLIMGANASGLTWPDDLVARLATRHPVIRYDHRDTGRSTWGFDEAPYSIADLATDAVEVLDAWGADRAHAVGMSMGATLVQLLALDHPDRLLSMTMLCASALGAESLPGPAPGLLRMWDELDDPRDDAGELAWRVEHWRLLNGRSLPFDAAGFRALEERILRHTGHPDSPTAHARADLDGLDRGAELSGVAVPALVIEGPADPVNPPPHSEFLAAALGDGRLVSVPGMGHALGGAVVAAVADAILDHTAARWVAPLPGCSPSA